MLYRMMSCVEEDAASAESYLYELGLRNPQKQKTLIIFKSNQRQ